MARTASATASARGDDRPRAAVRAASRRSRCSRRSPAAKFDETVEVHFRLGLNVRHADEQLRGTLDAPARHRQGRRRSPSSPRATRRARPRTPAPTSSARPTSPSEIEERLHRLRRRDRDARPDGRRRQARPRPRPARPDAEPEDRHGHVRRRARPSRDAKAGKLEYRTDRGANVHSAIGKKSFDERAAARELRRA